MSLEGEVFTAIWVFARIQSPFLLACSYQLIKRFDKIASPYLIVPGLSAICLAPFLGILPSDAQPFSFHFLVAGGFMLSSYFWLWRVGYSRPDSLVLSILVFVASDALWQIPYNFYLWTYSLRFLEVGLATDGWNLMSIPLIGYFLLKMNGKIAIDKTCKLLLTIIVISTTLSLLIPIDPLGYISVFAPQYLLIFPWFGAFLLIIRSSRKANIYLIDSESLS
jgi:hypothetical protein